MNRLGSGLGGRRLRVECVYHHLLKDPSPLLHDRLDLHPKFFELLGVLALFDLSPDGFEVLIKRNKACLEVALWTQGRDLNHEATLVHREGIDALIEEAHLHGALGCPDLAGQQLDVSAYRRELAHPLTELGGLA
jgi:hypothetical protein